MFGTFKTPPYHDEVLGDLTSSGRHWKGSFLLAPHGLVELIVSGDRSSPDSAALTLARELPARYAVLRPEIQASLFEHYEPGRDAVLEGAFPQHVKPFPEIINSDATWLYVKVAFVRIESLLTAGQMVITVEVAYTVVWDEEHTIGAWIQGWRLLELCGSV